ncbi:dynamin family protein [Bacillus sp. V3B]|uniref:dynamin family protein n=1 Tax=Bacillus sp. V3B TaxID=2804915 RepID=UPI00210BA654|nr:dynamin family protein [Bacillus sp. V3B]MCQ6275168.1 dynamin family protein [Bacillus sp. V3B]
MTIEKQLIEKMYYETFLNNDPEKEPIQVLGEAYMEEQKKGIPDLSSIRFAQGELYFQYKDYEAAIFKWENIENEWGPWAKKNMADAYFELRLLPTAEDIYKSITTDDLTLHIEVSLQLFSLYIERGKLELATQVIKETISLNPDYPNVTRLAQSFFEKHQDWSNAIELALNEAMRLESTQWYDVLIGYVEEGRTRTKEPVYFENVLSVLTNIDADRFERFVASLWNSYKDRETHISWMVMIDRVMTKLDRDRVHSWSELSRLYEESYLKLINGTHLIEEIGAMIPSLLTNWMKICDSNYALAAATAVISWSEMFPRTLESSTVYEAENLLLEVEQHSSGFEEAIRLADEILNWAGKQDLQVAKTITWILDTLKDKESYRLLIVGTNESGKSAVINSVVGRHVLPEDNSALVMVDYHDQSEIYEIAETEIQPADRIEEESSFRYQRSFHAKLDSTFLQENQISFIDTPSLNDSDELFSCLHAADGILFVLNANTPFTEKEQQVLLQIKEKIPNVTIHFLLNKMDGVYDEKVNNINEIGATIKSFVQEAEVFAFSSHYDSHSQLSDLRQFLSTHYTKADIVVGRTTNLLYFIRRMITYLLSKRVEKENMLVDSIKWNEEMVSKLSGAIHQMGDLEAEKVRMMAKSYHSIRDKMKQELMEKIPKLLRECSEYIKENSDFRNLHIALNDEMNKKLEIYLEEQAMPEYFRSIQQWIADCADEFNEVQISLDEMCEGFNALYDKDKLKLKCDFKVLEDWRRDADRMTSGIYWEKMNILLRFTPSQFLLKSAGKLLGGLSQNKTMLYNKYKQYVETEDYQEVAQLIASRFLQQFELFEKSIERDITIFFRNPLAVLNQTVEESRLEIAKNKEALDNIRQNPEWYQDPLTFFELKLRQNEWLNQKESPGIKTGV